MELLGEEDNTDTRSLAFEKEIGVRIIKAERATFALNKFLKSKVFSKKTKARIYTAIIRPTLTYGCEAWATTINTERKLRTFENKIWRVICGPMYDNEKGTWRRKYNKELQEEMEIASVDDIRRVVLEWKPTRKRPRGRPRKRWLDVVEEDLYRMGVQDWRVLAQDRDKWRDLVMAVKTLKEY
ncbi:Reverse transcriptase domain-containing protein [Aphis craccivora]|uniref:Reverse transcriptase domain-containing protein n=1 Tax=Aphis craccivora TaxID=307492 RepID=A0A6G0YWD3_APHCR|nr:Reverse transcriptase domain-containing protein [Aphis craccivora]